MINYLNGEVNNILDGNFREVFSNPRIKKIINISNSHDNIILSFPHLPIFKLYYKLNGDEQKSIRSVISGEFTYNELNKKLSDCDYNTVFSIYFIYALNNKIFIKYDLYTLPKGSFFIENSMFEFQNLMSSNFRNDTFLN